MRKTALALGAAASIALVGAAGVAAPLAMANAGLHLSVKPSRPAPGATLKLHGTGAVKHGTYVCVTTLVHKHFKPSAKTANVNNTVQRKANSKGVVKCSIPFLPFTNKINGKNIHCPPTKKNKRAGWGCGAAIANLHNHKQFVIKKFKF